MESILIRKLKQQVDGFINLLRVYELQFVLGKNEAYSYINNEKKHLADFITNREKNSPANLEDNEELNAIILPAIQELKSQLKIEIPSDTALYNACNESIMTSIADLDKIINDNLDRMDDSIKTKLLELRKELETMNSALRSKETGEFHDLEVMKKAFAKRLKIFNSFLLKSKNRKSVKELILTHLLRPFDSFGINKNSLSY